MNKWKIRYNDPKQHGTADPQLNVGRTKGGASVAQVVWDRTVQDIIALCQVSRESVVLELCCGNGMLLGPISKICRKAIGVDFSVPLLNELKREYGESIESHLSDVMDFTWKVNSVDVVLIYFSIQHFSEREALLLIEKARGWLKDGGVLFIGDVPDEERKWSYLSEPRHRRDYFERVKNDTPMIGQWFRREFFQGLVDYIPDITVTVADQPDHHINSDIRFDVVIRKYLK